MSAYVYRVRDDDTLDTVRVKAAFSHGQPLDFSIDETVNSPRGFLGDGQYLLRVTSLDDDRFGVSDGDLLTVDEKTAFASGQLVLAESDSRAYLGHWHAQLHPPRTV